MYQTGYEITITFIADLADFARAANTVPADAKQLAPGQRVLNK
jgi:hypothetical protein